MRFEYFLVLLKNSQFIMGNSSSGVREAPHYGVPAINIGSRQSGRVSSKLVVDSGFSHMDILTSIEKAMAMPRNAEFNFGGGNSAKLFGEIMSSGQVWQSSIQKTFQSTERV
jgi:UDP-N-acetylglucosamine 2-epimerase (hydrolysing)